MRELQFNFNNEVDVFPITELDDGKIQVRDGDEVLAEYDNLQQFAETYALARSVAMDNLKNWILVENGNEVSFVLRAGTAGIEMTEEIAQAFDAVEAAGQIHPLDLESLRREVAAGDDLLDVLLSSVYRDAAKAVYDVLHNQEGEPETEEPQETVSEMARFLEPLAATPDLLYLVCDLTHIPRTTEITEIEAALERGPATYTVEVLSELMSATIRRAIDNGENVATLEEVLLLLVRHVNITPEAKKKLMQAVRMSGRNTFNMLKYTVGAVHIKKEQILMPLEALDEADITYLGGRPAIVVFDESIDEEMSRVRAERQAAESQAAEAENETVTGAMVRQMMADVDDGPNEDNDNPENDPYGWDD